MGWAVIDAVHNVAVAVAVVLCWYTRPQRGRLCWPPGWHGIVIGQIGVAVDEHGRIAAVRLLCTNDKPGKQPKSWLKVKMEKAAAQRRRMRRRRAT